MARFAVRRIFQMLIVMFAVSVLTFLIFNVMPGGDPAPASPGASPIPASWSGSAWTGASTSPSTFSTSRPWARSSAAT